VGRSAQLGWAFASAVRAGAGKPECQDACRVWQDGDRLIAVVADGAGSALMGGEGARLAVEVFSQWAGAPTQAAGVATRTSIANLMSARAISVLFDAIRVRLEREAGSTNISQYSCTLVAFVADRDEGFFLQVGDGVAVFSSKDKYHVAIRSSESEFLNVTCFVTDPRVREHVLVRPVKHDIDAVALFSDGLEGLVIDAATVQPHTPFFDRTFGALHHAPGADDRASEWLQNMLASDPVQRRTDDDTSIVVARRIRC
jgi:serine/threonine protein phosphatase PrpC